MEVGGVTFQGQKQSQDAKSTSKEEEARAKTGGGGRTENTQATLQRSGLSPKSPEELPENYGIM